MFLPPRRTGSSDTRRIVSRICVTLIALVCFVSTALAQSTGGQPGRSPQASREDLMALAADAERQAASAGQEEVRREKRIEAAEIRERLRDGDFQVGDRIVLRVRGDSALSDTFVVRAGRILSLPNFSEISLAGVLRSELQAFLSKEIARYVREPVVQTSSLIRLAVLGEVTRPGFYAVGADVLVTDAIMAAGGPNGEADLRRVVVRRGAREVWTADQVHTAMTQGATLDQLNLRAGDEIVVGERKRRGFGPALQVVSALSAIAIGVFTLSR
jgi:protein involved in polysaccharide export with SLBB domain